jgi:6-phosphofructokinase 1
MRSKQESKERIGILTSGGDAPGMNAAIRAAVRTALYKGVEPFVIKEGYEGLIKGGDKIIKADWNYVSGIIQKGGTKIKSSRSQQFENEEGQLEGAKNLLVNRITRLIVIGGDGSLKGAKIFFDNWHTLIDKLITDLDAAGNDKQKQKTKKLIFKNYPALRERHPELSIVGLVASIDNDMYGTEMTIGADSALHRISEAVDAISCTADSHLRTFVIEVMGRDCGYLALMSTLITGADWVFIPESPNSNSWEQDMREELRIGRNLKRDSSIVILAEKAKDSNGVEIKNENVKEALKSFDPNVKETVLGHLQRGGAPSAYDRIMSTRLGYEAVKKILSLNAGCIPYILLVQGNAIESKPLNEIIENNDSIKDDIAAGDYEAVKRKRSKFFKRDFEITLVLKKALPKKHARNQKKFRFAVMHSGAPAPGMNTAVRAAVRYGIEAGHEMLGIEHGFEGLIKPQYREMDWMSVNGWAPLGGAILGTNRTKTEMMNCNAINKSLKFLDIKGLLIIGGCSGYESASLMDILRRRQDLFGFNIPVICLPATILNNLPGTEISIGSDTALNNICEAMDNLKQSAFSSRNCFISEVAGQYCGYLALMSGIATGAEQIYLHEIEFTTQDMRNDVKRLHNEFRRKIRKLALMIRNEKAHPYYDLDFMRNFFNGECQKKFPKNKSFEEHQKVFNVRESILGHLQHGGDPSPYDRIWATRLAVYSIKQLIKLANEVKQNRNIMPPYQYVGYKDGEIVFTGIEQFEREMNMKYHRPHIQWWLDELTEMAKIMSIFTS